MGKQAESEPSDFWTRLADAWEPKGLPTSQNGVARELKMSQGSTRRWYTGDGYPETQVLREIARKGNVTIDWLLNGTLPRTPTAAHTPLGRLLLVWEQLDETARELLYKTAQGQLALSTNGTAPRRPTIHAVPKKAG